jgi:hypothetical protein
MAKTRTHASDKPRSRMNVPANKTLRYINTQAEDRREARSKLRRLPLRGPNPVTKSERAQAERAYRGDTSRRLDVSRGKRLGDEEARTRYGGGVTMGTALRRRAKNAGTRPKKVSGTARGKQKAAGSVRKG